MNSKIYNKNDIYTMHSEDILRDLFHFREQTHIWHLQCTNHATHIALGDFYEELDNQIDALIEGLMAQGMLLDAGKIEIPMFANFDIELVKAAFKEFLSYIELLHQQFELSAIQNILDDMSTLGNQTLYLLRFS